MTTSKLISKSINAVAWNIAGAGGRSIAQLVIQIALARILGPDVFGQFTIVFTVLGISWLAAESGFGSALIQKTSLTSDDVSYALGWVLLIGSLIGSVIFMAAPYLTDMFDEPALINVFRVCGLLVLLQALSNIPASLMRRDLAVKSLQVINLSSYIVGYGVVGIWLALKGAGVWSLIVAFFIQILISLIAMYNIVRHTLRPSLTGDATLRSFGLRVVATNMINWAIENIDKMIVGRIWGLSSLGTYNTALNLSRAPVVMIVGSLQSVVFAAGARVNEDVYKLRRGYLAILGATMLLALPLFSLLGVAAETVIGIIYGDRWQTAAPMFAAFSVSMPFYIITAITGPVLWGMNQVRKELYIQISVFIVMILGFWLLSDFPLSTTAWLIPVIYFLRALLMMWALSTLIKLSISDIYHSIRGGILLACLASGFWLLLSLMKTQDYKFITIINLHGHAFDAVRLIICILLCGTILVLSRGCLLGAETKSLLINRIHESRVARVLLKMAGL